MPDDSCNPTIRRGEPGDVPAALRLLRECVEKMRAAGIDQWDEIYPDRETIERDLAARTLHVASDGAALAGIIVLDANQPAVYAEMDWLYRDAPQAVVHRLAVAPRCQGRGVACQLMDFVERRAVGEGFTAIRLDAFVHNPAAVTLYERRQYRRAGVVHFRKGPFYCFEKRLLPP